MAQLGPVVEPQLGFTYRQVRGLARQLSRAQVTEMPAGHAPQMVSMNRFLAEMAAFQASKKT